MVRRTFLLIFHVGSRRLGSNNFRNSSYKEKTAGSTRVSRTSSSVAHQMLLLLFFIQVLSIFPKAGTWSHLLSFCLSSFLNVTFLYFQQVSENLKIF